MGKNFTPVNVSSLLKKEAGAPRLNGQKSAFDLNVVFLTLIVISLLILSFLLFLLIQKKLQELSFVFPYFA